MFTIEQGIILKYHDDTSPRTCDVLQIPDNYVMSNVRLPHTLIGAGQTKPLPQSLVLVVSMDDYKSFLLCVLRDPEDFLQLGEGVRGAFPDTANFLQPGEIVLEAAGSGDEDTVISGTGGSIFLGNDGTVNLRSGKLKESLVLGGTDDDNDGEVLLTGDNGYYESNINEITQVRSTYRFDSENNLTLGNMLVAVTPVAEVETPISVLTMDTLGNIKLNNAVTGVDNAVLQMDATGQIALKNTLGSLQISNLGAYTLTTPAASMSLSNTGAFSLTTPAASTSISNSGAISVSGATLSVSMSGSITQTGSTINLNSGSFGVARVNDTVTSNISTDPAFWAFWSTIAVQIAALPTTPLDGGATLKAGLATLFGTMPQTIISKITTGSTTVKAGG